MLYTLGRHRQVFWGSSVSLSLMSQLWGPAAGGALVFSSTVHSHSMDTAASFAAWLVQPRAL